MRTVIYCGRHGEKNGDSLTDLGIRQVEASRVNLPRVFDAVLSSTFGRALLTARIATAGKFKGDIQVRTSLGVDYMMDPAFPKPNGDHTKVEEMLAGKGTVAQWLELWPPFIAARGRFSRILSEIALEYIGGAVYIANHSPHCESAVIDVNNFPRLQPADIVRYTLEERVGDLPVIVSSEYLPCPAVD